MRRFASWLWFGSRLLLGGGSLPAAAGRQHLIAAGSSNVLLPAWAAWVVLLADHRSWRNLLACGWPGVAAGWRGAVAAGNRVSQALTVNRLASRH